MRYYKVLIPTLQVYRLRQVEPGMMLGRTVFTPDGRVLAEGDTILTADLIRQFKNFKVRKTVVREEQEHWISEREEEKLPGGAEVIESEQFSEAADQIVETVRNTNSINKMRQVAEYLAQTAVEQEKGGEAEELNEIIDRSYELEEEIEELMGELETVEDPVARDKIMEALESTISEVEETFLEISAPDSLLRSSLDALNKKENIRSSITAFLRENQEVADSNSETSEAENLSKEDLDDECSYIVEEIEAGRIVNAVDQLQKYSGDSEVVEDLEELKERLRSESAEKESLKKELSVETSDIQWRTELLSVIDGGSEPKRKKLEAAPLSQDFVSKTLSFCEERQENRHRLWEAGNKATNNQLEQSGSLTKFVEITQKTSFQRAMQYGGENGSTGGGMTDEEVKEVLTGIETDDLQDSAKRLLEVAERENTDASLAARLKLAQKSSDDLETEARELERIVEDEVDATDIREKLLSAIKGKRELEEESLERIPVSKEVSEELVDFSHRRRRHQSRLLDAAEELSGRSEADLKRKQATAVKTKEKESEAVEESREKAVGDSEMTEKSEADEYWESLHRVDDEELQTALKEGDEYDVADLTGLDPQTVRTARQVFVRPPARDRRLKSITDASLKIINSALYERKLEQADVSNLIGQTGELLENFSGPVELLRQPPSEEQFLLTHAVNTFIFSLFLANQLGLTDAEMETLTTAALLQDLGMTEIPSALWVKEGSLTNRGWGEVRKHPSWSSQVIADAAGDFVEEEEAKTEDEEDGGVAELILQHHERLDGSGYPRGIEGEEQHSLAPVLAIADAYTALLEPRPHRGPTTPDKALLRLLKNKRQFSRSICKQILVGIGFYPNSVVILLSNGSLAQVEEQNQGRPLSPVVRVLTDENRRRLDQPERLNIDETDGVKVKQIVKL